MQISNTPVDAPNAALIPSMTARPEVHHVLLTDHQVVSELLQGLRLAAQEDVHFRSEPMSGMPIASTGDAPQISISEKMFCSYCESNFTDRTHQKSHYKTDWHRYNLRQKLKGLEPISEDKFEELAAGDISSISGSDSSDSSVEDRNEKTKKLALPEPVMSQLARTEPDSESDSEMSVHVEGIGRRHPRVFLRTADSQLISIYRCIVHSNKNQPEDQQGLVSMVTALPQQTKWAIFLTASGHFAAAVFDGSDVLAHKTFHRYTVRAKRGTAQGARDKRGNAPHSAGASLRRYNEAALGQEVADLIGVWSTHIKSCDRIFLRAPSYNRAMFFSGKTPPLDKKDPRIRLIPFPTRRPTFSELQRVHGILASVECYGEESTIHDHIQTSPRRVKHETQRHIRPQPSDKPQRDDIHKIQEEQEQDDDEDGAIELVSELETMQMSDLNPYKSTKNPRKRNKRKPSNKDKEATVFTRTTPLDATVCQPQEEYSPEEYRLRNKLYTACKVGDLQQLKEILSPLLRKDIGDEGRSSEGDIIKRNPEETTTKYQDDANTILMEDVSNSCEHNVKRSLDNQAKGHMDDIKTSCSCVAKTISSDKASQIEAQSVLDKACLTVDIPANTDLEGELEAKVGLRVDLLNIPFGESGRTLLHLGAAQDHADIIMWLLEAGADPTIRDSDGKTPYLVGTQKSVRNQFRQFMGHNPDRHDYIAAQIPPPVSTEREVEKKAKEAERRKLAKKARNARLKDKKAEEAEKAAEQCERDRYLKLSDREKRALAAERRLVSQLNTEGKPAPALSRCWQCGTDTTGKVPFEYFDYKFCTPTCLKAHKLS